MSTAIVLVVCCGIVGTLAAVVGYVYGLSHGVQEAARYGYKQGRSVGLDQGLMLGREEGWQEARREFGMSGATGRGGTVHTIRPSEDGC